MRGGAIAITIIMLMSTVAALIYHVNAMPEYRAEARFKVLRSRITVGIQSGVDPANYDQKGFAAEIAQMQSVDIINRVANRLTPEERKAVLASCRQIVPDHTRFIVVVQYTHPNRALALKMTNYFVDEIQRANDEENTSLSSPLVERLSNQLQQIQQDIQNLRDKRNMLSLEKDIRNDFAALAEYEELSKEIKIRKTNYTILSHTYQRKLADQPAIASPIKLIEPATAGDRPVNKHLWATLFSGWTIGAIISGLLVIVLGARMGFRRCFMLLRRFRPRLPFHDGPDSTSSSSGQTTERETALSRHRVRLCREFRGRADLCGEYHAGI